MCFVFSWGDTRERHEMFGAAAAGVDDTPGPARSRHLHPGVHGRRRIRRRAVPPGDRVLLVCDAGRHSHPGLLRPRTGQPGPVQDHQRYAFLHARVKQLNTMTTCQQCFATLVAQYPVMKCLRHLDRTLNERSSICETTAEIRWRPWRHAHNPAGG